jgi:hypothetical protein
MTSEIEKAILDLQNAHNLSSSNQSDSAAVIIAQVARDLIDALLASNTLGPDPDNDPNNNRSSGGGTPLL